MARLKHIPHHNLVLCVLVVAVVGIVLRLTNENPATLISLSALLATVPMSLAFGAQTLLQGIIAGRTLAAERRFREGDTLDINGKSGRVASIGLRVTELRDADNNTVVVPNQVILTSMFTVHKEHL